MRNGVGSAGFDEDPERLDRRKNPSILLLTLTLTAGTFNSDFALENENALSLPFRLG